MYKYLRFTLLQERFLIKTYHETWRYQDIEPNDYVIIAIIFFFLIFTANDNSR